MCSFAPLELLLYIQSILTYLCPFVTPVEPKKTKNKKKKTQKNNSTGFLAASMLKNDLNSSLYLHQHKTWIQKREKQGNTLLGRGQGGNSF